MHKSESKRFCQTEYVVTDYVATESNSIECVNKVQYINHVVHFVVVLILKFITKLRYRKKTEL